MTREFALTWVIDPMCCEYMQEYDFYCYSDHEPTKEEWDELYDLMDIEKDAFEGLIDNETSGLTWMEYHYYLHPVGKAFRGPIPQYVLDEDEVDDDDELPF